MSRWMFLVSVLAACARSNSERCPDGTICPDGTSCVVLGGAATRCVLPDAFDACDGLTDGAACTLQGATGTCTTSVCIAAVCGDGVVDANERCDDGNTSPHDGCSADCRSIETCGDTVVDLAIGEQCDGGLVGLSGDGCTSGCRTEYNIWRDVTPSRPNGRTLFNVVTDRDGGVTMLGGFTGTVPLPGGTSSGSLFVFTDHWSWDGATWLGYDAPTGRPPQRVIPAVAYDDVRQRHLVFGGIVEGPSGYMFSDQMWQWDGITWSQIPKSGMWPSPRGAASFACGGGRCVLFGGRTGAGQQSMSDEVWSWDGTAWTKIVPADADNAPSKRWHAAFAYDSVNARFVLIGGETGDMSPMWSNETWALRSNNTWQALDPAPLVNGAYPTAAFDPSLPPNTGRVVVAAQGDTPQQLTGSIWTSVPTGLQVDARIAYSPRLGRIVALGTILGGDVRARSLIASTSWIDDAPIALNVPSSDARAMALAYDARRGVTVAVDNTIAQNASPETWEWNGSSWRRTSITGPVGANATGLAYDAACGKTLQYGGESQSLRANETWLYDGTWTEYTGSTPTTRSRHRLAYDAARDEVVMFGGNDGTGALDETWRFTGPCNARVWTQATPATSPPARQGAGLAYDARRGVVVLFGGSTGTEELDDTWEWDGTTWTQRTPVTSPPPRVDHAMAFDPRRGRIVIFGGNTGLSERNDTWEWDGTTWRELQTVASPIARTGISMAPDVTGALVFAGGKSQLGDATETWQLRSEQIVEPREGCTTEADDDFDGLGGCADPDCWTRCTPLCQPGATCDGPHCGDGTCSAPLETYASCPQDCT